MNWTVVLETVVNWVDQNIWGCGGGGGGDAPGPGGGGSMVTISHASDIKVIAQTGNSSDPTLVGALFQIQGSKPVGKMIVGMDIPGKTSFAENGGTPLITPLNAVSLPVNPPESQNNPVGVTDAVFQQWETKSIYNPWVSDLGNSN
ncbi:MAG TPA: hypothetical protein VGY77_04590 [Gemmataceae bacterium]|nr:hypothetical protein [Gemmataceae bacterium]